MDKDTVDYIIEYYSNLLSIKEKVALKHIRSLYKLDGKGDSNLRKMYLKRGWISTDKEILSLLDDGHDSFLLKISERIVKENKEKVFFNNCPKCNKLARTPFAKQCRFCGNSWRK